MMYLKSLNGTKQSIDLTLEEYSRDFYLSFLFDYRVREYSYVAL